MTHALRFFPSAASTLAALTVVTAATFGLAGSTQAGALDEHPDCALFSEANLGGAYWTTQADRESFSAKLTPWWQHQAACIYVRDGFVFEGYEQPNFRGATIALSRETSGMQTVGDGAAVNLGSLHFDHRLGSFRCRVAAEMLTTQLGATPWSEGARYYWYSGGNHPDQKWVEMHTVEGHAVVTAHSDDTYGINAQNYRLDLTSGEVTIEFVTFASVKGTTTFALRLANVRRDFKNMIGELEATLRTIAGGYNFDYVGKVAPPAPELVDFAEALHLSVNPSERG